MKREDVFEVHEPPPRGLTRLRARMEERRASRVLRPVLVVAVLAVVALLVLWPRAEVERVDFSQSVAALDAMPAGASVMALGETGVEPLRSTNAQVVLVRVFAAERANRAP